MILKQYIRFLLENIRLASNVRGSIYTRIKLWTKALRFRGYDVRVKFDAPFFLSALFVAVSENDWEDAVKEAMRSSSEVGLTKYFDYESEDRSERTLTLAVIPDKMDITSDGQPDYKEIGLKNKEF